ncbi:tail fiber domain-containing protein [Citrobacter braakii]|uniref:tail fiber domain-containing protein n=1 Tax=Citrobacter braakii TaxID=57706 RepID=UPI0029D9403C|nr:tail fiber domain-containing protein [Citrobacter braakii]MDX7345820.1 tail fiber domain-containing protein [Citrobacter braakii]
MSAGTLTLTNNSAAVAGNGTAFTTEVAAGDFIVVTVGGVPYTLPVKSVESGTALTLVSNYTGPTQSGAAWSAVPRVALNMVTAAMVVQNTQALLGLNYDKQNWQQVFSNSGNITVKLPDSTTFTGPSWLRMIDLFNSKRGLPDAWGTAAGLELPGRLYTGYVICDTDAPISQVGAYMAQNAGNSRMGLYNNSGSRSGGFDLVMARTNGVEKMRWSGNVDGHIVGPLGRVHWEGSDVRIKYDFEPPKTGHSERIAALGVTEFKYNGGDAIHRGFLAQQAEAIDGCYVHEGGIARDESGKKFTVLNVDNRAIVADLVLTVQDLMREVSELKTASAAK